MDAPFAYGLTGSLSRDLVIRKIAAQGLAPQLGRNGERIDFPLLPPPPLVSGGVNFTVVDNAQRHCEFIAHFERNSFRLSVANVMRLRGDTATNQACLAGYKA